MNLEITNVSQLLALFSRWCSSVRCVVADVELESAFQSYRPLIATSQSCWDGPFAASFRQNILIYIYVCVCVKSYSFISFFQYENFHVLKLNGRVLVVAKLNGSALSWVFILMLKQAWSVDFVYPSFRCFFNLTCPQMPLYHYVQVVSPERGQLKDFFHMMATTVWGCV